MCGMQNICTQSYVRATQSQKEHLSFSNPGFENGFENGLEFENHETGPEQPLIICVPDGNYVHTSGGSNGSSVGLSEPNG